MVLGIALALALLVVSGVTARILFAAEPKSENSSVKNHEWQLPDESLKLSFKEEQPIVFVNRGQNASEWESLKSYWNPMTEKAIDPKTGVEVTRTVVKIKVPLGLNANPPVPTENPMSVAKWKLGKELYFDTALSSDGSVSCASCHAPDKGYTDQSRVSVGIGGNVGGVSSPTVFNSAYGPLQFWDGRAASLEEQSQGPPQNPVEMFDGKGNAWQKVVERLRAKPDTVKLFAQVFGTLPNRDGVAKAIAAYERTVLTGNSIHDRAELSMRKRVEAEETGKLELQAKDYATVLKEAFAAKDNNAVEALGLSLDKDATKIEDTAKKLVNGRNLFFGKARCSACHIGDNFTDNSFHNLGVGAKDLKIPESSAGRYGALPTGHKNPESYGAFKTPTLRKLLSTAPYMHDGSEKTLEETVEFYDRGGNANEFLDIKMRDEEAERAWYKAKAEGKEYKGPAVQVFNGKAIVPLKLNLTAEEKANVVLFMKALQGDKLDPIIAEPKTQPK
jgi:cytochrome c peroxidase